MVWAWELLDRADSANDSGGEDWAGSCASACGSSWRRINQPASTTTNDVVTSGPGCDCRSWLHASWAGSALSAAATIGAVSKIGTVDGESALFKECLSFGEIVMRGVDREQDLVWFRFMPEPGTVRPVPTRHEAPPVGSGSG